jgi:FixJ family two-component response regulator
MIAIIYDNEAVRQATKSLLRSLGHRVATFATAEEFLISDQLQETSCLITDVQMPGISGIELLEHLKADGYRFPVMVITAFPNDHIRDRAMQVGASCFLTKPFSHESFTECLERALTSLSKPLHN